MSIILKDCDRFLKEHFASHSGKTVLKGPGKTLVIGKIGQGK